MPSLQAPDSFAPIVKVLNTLRFRTCVATDKYSSHTCERESKEGGDNRLAWEYEFLLRGAFEVVARKVLGSRVLDGGVTITCST